MTQYRLYYMNTVDVSKNDMYYEPRILLEEVYIEYRYPTKEEAVEVAQSMATPNNPITVLEVIT